MSENAVEARNIGKVYKVFTSPGERLLHALGLGSLVFWKRKAFCDLWALRGVDLVVKKGERLGIIGRNGAGKSTLLKIISGTVATTTGEIVVRGRIQALLGLGIGFHPELTGRENVRAALAYQGIAAEREALEKEIIEFAELEESIDQPIRTFSSGMYTRLAFAVATAVQPEILIVDEILGAGDAYFAGKCFERMRRLSEESGASVLMVSHDLGAIQSLCDRVIWIDAGMVKAEGKALEVIKEYGRDVRLEEEARLRLRDWKAIDTQGLLGDYSRLREVRGCDGYGSGEIAIRRVTLNSGEFQDIKSLYSLEPFEVTLEWIAKLSVCDPVFVFCIYLPSGECASQWIVSSREMGVEIVTGVGKVTFKSDQLLLGKGYYIASAGIFKKRPERGLEPPAYHVLDRSVHFRVVDSNLCDSINYGICRQPVSTEIRLEKER